MRITKTSIAGAALLTALAAGAAVPVALAQTAKEDATESQTDNTVGDRHAGAKSDFAAALAEELGLDVDRVTEALETVQTELAAARSAEHLARMEARLDAAVEDGTLSREQADAILEAREAGVIGGFGGRGHRGGFGQGGFGHGGPGGGGGPGMRLPDARDSEPDASESATDA